VYRRYRCKRCLRTFNDKSGTDFEYSRIPLNEYLFITYLSGCHNVPPPEGFYRCWARLRLSIPIIQKGSIYCRRGMLGVIGWGSGVVEVGECWFEGWEQLW
jgi:hypothetical protein